MDMTTADCGKKQPCRPSDMSDSSRYLYGHLPPDIMSKGLPNNGNDMLIDLFVLFAFRIFAFFFSNVHLSRFK